MNSSPLCVGVLGMGIIGSRVAENLRQKSFSVRVWSRTGQAVEGAQDSPQEVARAARVIQIFVRDDQALLEAVENMLPALTSNHVVMNHATVSKEATLAAARLIEGSGARFLDAPFTGSKMAAQNGKLCYYVGGDAQTLKDARSVLEASSASILHLGAVGDAMVLKIVTNLITSVTVKALSEAAAITRSQGVPLEALKKALESNANYSTLIGMKLPAIMNDDFEPHFSLINMLKDADFALELAKQGGKETPALQCTAEAMRAGVNKGLGDLDFSIIGKV